MTIPNVSEAPTVWRDEELPEHAQRALEQFVDRRLAEPGGKYLDHLDKRRRAITQLFKKLSGVDPEAPDPATVRAVIRDDELFDALCYVTAPPVSEDDLGVIVTRNVKGITRTELKSSDDLPVDVLKLICRLADPLRFPWIAHKRAPLRREIHAAIQSTAAMHAAQSLQTERRAYGKDIERLLEARLVEMQFVRLSGKKPPKSKKPKKGEPPLPPAPPLPPFPKGGKIKQPSSSSGLPVFLRRMYGLRPQGRSFYWIEVGPDDRPRGEGFQLRPQ